MQQQGQQSASNSPGLLHLPIRSDEQQQQQQLTTAGSLERSGGLGGVCGDDDDEPLQQQQLTSTSSLEHSGGLGGVCGDVEEPQQQKQLEGAAEAHQQQLEGVETQQRQQQPQEGEHDTLQQLRQASPARQDSQEPEQQQQQQAAAGSPDGQSPAPKGLKPQHWARVSQLVQAVAAALGSTNKTGLQTALDQIKTWGEAIPVHRKGNLQYCSMCNEDLEDALLVYMMVSLVLHPETGECCRNMCLPQALVVQLASNPM
jgi:hypothetical protein